MRLCLSASACGLIVVLNACASVAMPPTVSSSPPTTSTRCDPQAARNVIGQAASATVVEQARQATGAQSVRTLKPGQVITMEYREGRLNVHVNERGAITSLTCG